MSETSTASLNIYFPHDCLFLRFIYLWICQCIWETFSHQKFIGNVSLCDVPTICKAAKSVLDPRTVNWIGQIRKENFPEIICISKQASHFQQWVNSHAVEIERNITFFFLLRQEHVTQTSLKFATCHLELLILLLPTKCWDYSSGPPSPVDVELEMERWGFVYTEQAL